MVRWHSTFCDTGEFFIDYCALGLASLTTLRIRAGTRMNSELQPDPPSIEDAEQAGSSNGGQRPSLNSGFHYRRGWPKRSAEM